MGHELAMVSAATFPTLSSASVAASDAVPYRTVGIALMIRQTNQTYMSYLLACPTSLRRVPVHGPNPLLDAQMVYRCSMLT